MLNDVLQNLLGKTAKKRRERSSRLDKLQAAADVGGVFDQSGLTDLGNAAVSLIRGLGAKTKAEQREHMRDALIRGVSAVPIVGDLAKLARAPKYLQTLKGQSTTARAVPAAKPGTPSKPTGSILPSLMAMMGGGRSSGPRIPPASQGTGQRPQQGFFRSFVSGVAQRVSTAQRDPAAQPTGLSPSEKIAMMGKSTQEIQDADRRKRAEQEATIAEEEATAQLQELTEKFKGATKGIGAFTLALVAIPKLVQRWGDALIESRRDLAELDGRIASSYAQLDIQRFRQNVETARDTGGSSARVAQEMAELHRSLQPLRELKATLENALAIAAVNVATAISDGMGKAAKSMGLLRVVRSLEKWLSDQEMKNSLPIHETVARMIKEAPLGMGQREPLPPL